MSTNQITHHIIFSIKKRSPETIMTFICLLWLFYKNNALCISEKEFKGKPRVSDRAGREHVACLRSHCIWSIDPIDSTEDDEAIYRDAYLQLLSSSTQIDSWYCTKWQMWNLMDRFPVRGMLTSGLKNRIRASVKCVTTCEYKNADIRRDMREPDFRHPFYF